MSEGARPRPELVLAGVALLWGSTFVVTKHVVRDMAPLAFLTARFGLAALVLVALFRRRFPCSRQALVDGVVLGLLNSSGLLLQVLGQVYTTASKSSFITALNTPLTPLCALALYRARPTRPQLVAVVLASGGVALLTYPVGGARWNDGDLLTFGCAALYAITIVEIARRTPRHDALMLTTVQVVTAALMFATLLGVGQVIVHQVRFDHLPELLRLEARPFAPGPWALAELVYMALVCTVVTFAAQTWAMARMSATHAAVIFSLEPVFATAMAVGAVGSAEWPGARGATGAALVLFGVLVSEIRLR
jgi:drug/metabolite transporter (DMT)-like permease